MIIVLGWIACGIESQPLEFLTHLSINSIVAGDKARKTKLTS